MTRVKPAGEPASRVRIRCREIKQMKSCARLQHAAHLTQRRHLFGSLQMVKHERREYPIEGAFRIGQLISKSLVEVDRKRGSLTLSSRACECLRVGVKAHHLD